MLSAAVTAELAKGQTLHGAVETGLQAVHRALAQPQRLSSSLSLGAVEASRDCSHSKYLKWRYKHQ